MLVCILKEKERDACHLKAKITMPEIMVHAKQNQFLKQSTNDTILKRLL